MVSQIAFFALGTVGLAVKVAEKDDGVVRNLVGKKNDSAVFRILFGEGSPHIIGLDIFSLEHTAAGEVCHEAFFALEFRHGTAGDTDFGDPFFSGDDTGFVFHIAVPLHIVFADHPAQIGDTSVAAQHDLVEHFGFAVIAEKELHQIVAPKIHGVKAPFGFKKVGGLRFFALKSEIEVILVAEHPDLSTHFDGNILFPAAGDHVNRNGAFPLFFIEFAVNGDLCFGFRHGGGPDLAVVVCFVKFFSAVKDLAPDLFAHEFHTGKGGFVFGNSFFSFVEKRFDTLHLGGGVDLVPDVIA